MYQIEAIELIDLIEMIELLSINSIDLRGLLMLFVLQEANFHNNPLFLYWVSIDSIITLQMANEPLKY